MNKALENIVDKLWRNDDIEQKRNMLRSTYRADAIGCLARGYVTASANAGANNDKGDKLIEFNFTPPITSDIIIDLQALDKNQTTKSFLTSNLKRKTPIVKAHSTRFLEQILCDSQISTPIKHTDSSISLGRKIRIAPTKMKRQLALENKTCSIQGCSIPASWCDAHHIRHWKDGGETTIENLVLLCSRHHTMIHNDKTFAEKTSQQLSKSKNRKNQPELIRTG